MQMIFRAFDGKEFDNAQDCFDYESKPGYQMWDEFGKTDDFDSAMIVNITTKPYATEEFCAACRDSDITSEGIDGVGLYVWAPKEFQWVRLDERAAKAAYHFYHLG
jgi:hypothetical protein